VTERKKRTILLLSLLLAGFSGSFLPGRISVTLTPTVKHRVWWLSQDTSYVRHGQYVLFHLPSSNLAEMVVPETVLTGKDIRVIKRVGCDEGEELKRKERDFYCGEEYLGHAKERSQQGETLTPFQFSGKIPAGKVFLVGDHPDSFDSRYFGLVEKSYYQAWARPIF
jgi:signal peptidase I/conjugal transfer pilin signal peptidase TrbI